MKILATVLALALPVAAHGVEAPAAKSLFERAIAVHGGAAALQKFPSLEMTGTIESLAGRSAGRRTDLVLRERSDGAYRRETTFEFRGTKRTSVEFHDGHVVKRRFGSSWDDMPLDEAREGAAHRLPFLLVAAAAEARVEAEGTAGEAACWRVSVPDGRERAILSFAKDDGRLVGLEYPGTTAEGMGTKKEVVRSLVFRDHRKVGGLLLPFDTEYTEAGTPDARVRFESIVVLPEFDGQWIKLPDPTRRFIPSEELSN